MKKFFRIFLVIACLAALLSTVAAAADTVYLKDGGTGNGTSADDAFGDLADAINALPNGGTVVLCGNYTLSNSLYYDASVPAFIAPPTEGVLTITGEGSKLICPGGSRYFCTQDTVFKNLTFTQTSKSTFVMAARFFDVTFAEGVVMENIQVHLIGGMEHTNAVVGVPNEDYSKDAHLTLLSGNFEEVTGLGRNVGKSGGKANYSGTAYITVGGEAHVNAIFGAYRWGSPTVLGGGADITLAGGTIGKYVCGCSERNEAHTVDVTIRMTKDADLSKYISAVDPGWTSGDTPAFYGFNASGLYRQGSNFGKTTLDLSDAPKVDRAWIERYVNTDSFDVITGYKEASVADQNVVFVSPNGSSDGDGRSYETAVPTIAAAYKKLSDGEGTIVICGKIVIDSSNASLPEHKGRVTFTSVYDNYDYQKVLHAKLAVTSNIFLAGDTTFDKITVEANSANRAIFCQGNSLCIGEDVNTTTGSGRFTIWGGTQCSRSGVTANTARYFDYTIEINSGTFRFVRGGSIRDGEYQSVGTIGNVTILINGGEFVATGTAPSATEIIAVSGFDALDGDANIIINGGTFNCSIMGIGRPGTNATASGSAYARGNINITINGGTFASGTMIGAIHDTVASELDGDFTLKVTGGNFASGFAGFSAESVYGAKVADIASSVSAPLIGFDKAIFVSDSGNDSASGATAQTAKKTIAAAVREIGEDGGTLVICGNVTVESAILSSYENTLRITSVWNNTDYRRAGAKLTVNGSLTLGGKTVFADLTLAGAGKVNANGYDLTVEENVAGGNLSLTGGMGETSHGITIRGGSFATVDGGSVSSTDASTYVLFYGGKAENLYGAAGGTAGTGSVSVRGGDVTGNLCGAMNGSGKSAGVEIRGGKVNAQNLLTASPSGSVKGGAFATDYATYKADNVLFVKDGGTGDGSTPDKALSDLLTASEKLKNGGTIVLCGKLTQNDGKLLRNMGGRVTLTSLYRGIDYTVTDDARIELRKYISFTSDVTIENIKIVAAANDTYLSAEGNDLVIGEGVVCEIFKGNRTEGFPDLVVGSVAQSVSLRQDLTVTVKSGTWGSLSGGQFSTTANSGITRRIEGNITLNVYGGKFTDDLFVAGVNNLIGNATLNAYGGDFACSVFGLAGQKVTATGKITVNAFGADFSGDIRAAQNNDPTLNGEYALNIYGGNLTRVSTVAGTEGLNGKHTSSVNTASGLSLTAPLSGNITYQNPVAGYADPSVVFADGWYYYTYCATYAGKDSLFMAKAANICDLGNVEPQLIWSQATTGEAPEMTALWAPQLFKLKDEHGVERWYIYAAAQTTKDANFNSNLRYPYVWVGEENDPAGTFKFFGCIENLDGVTYNYLSPRLITHDGNLYMFCSGFFRAEDMNPHIQRLRVCRLETPTKMATEQIVISSPCYPYEYSGSATNGIMEGPFPFYGPTGTLYLVFAAGHTRTDEYATGLMRFNGGENDPLTDASLWEKFEEPFQFTNYQNRVYSPGAMVLTTSPDGKHTYAAYHAKEYHYSAYTMRRLHIQEVTFDESGFPHIEDAQPVDTVFTIPMNSLPLDQRMTGFTAVGSLGDYAGKFKASRTYTDAFTDVPENAWFRPYVATAYAYTLANGTSQTTFSPNGKFTVAQALTAAANIHAAYTGKSVRAAAAGESWFIPYVEYCVENGIIRDGQFADLNANITRGDMAAVFANILPASEYTSVREGANPDVPESMACYAAVKKLYEAGIVGGDAGTGNYRPNDEIVRSEACVIFTRIAAANYRAK